VSIIRVDEGSHKRISGSCLGGGPFFGLVKQLTGAKTVEEAIKVTNFPCLPARCITPA